MADTKEDKDAKEAQPWTYKHPTDHPDNKPPVTAVAEDSEEAIKEYEIKVNAELEKGRPETLTEEQEASAKAATNKATDKPIDYEEKTVPELKEMAAEKGIQIPWDANKGDIIKALKKGK